MPQPLPIIYVRGYAGNQSDVEQTVDDPFYGFNTGSTHVRQDQSGSPEMYFFESPLLRLIADHGYSDVFNGYSQTISRICPDGTKTIWIHRYYDETSQTFNLDNPVRLTIEQAATDLRKLIDTVRQNVKQWCDTQTPPKAAPLKVILIAHSMGGLVCRCLLQKIFQERGENPHDFVDKFFTYATPHGGIHFDFPGGGGIEKIRDMLGINGSDTFGPNRLYQFLTPGDTAGKDAPKEFDPRVIYTPPDPPNGKPAQGFNPDRVFCLIGTNAKDYEVAMGLSRTAVGPISDGLVQIESAYVYKSHRAYVHRSHSGRYGIVNSEEGYENLERFLFGQMKVRAVLCEFNLSYPNPDTSYFFETRVAIRGVPVSMHERSLDHLCGIPMDATAFAEQQPKGLPIFTSFLIPSRSDDGRLQYMLRIAVIRQVAEQGFLPWKKDIARLPLWSDYLVIQVTPAPTGDYLGEYRWMSDGPDAPFRPLNDKISPVQEAVAFRAELPAQAKQPATFGDKAFIRLEASAWS